MSARNRGSSNGRVSGKRKRLQSSHNKTSRDHRKSRKTSIKSRCHPPYVNKSILQNQPHQRKYLFCEQNKELSPSSLILYLLPNEIITEIFRYMICPWDTKNIRLVCRLFHDLVIPSEEHFNVCILKSVRNLLVVCEKTGTRNRLCSQIYVIPQLFYTFTPIMTIQAERNKLFKPINSPMYCGKCKCFKFSQFPSHSNYTTINIRSTDQLNRLTIAQNVLCTVMKYAYEASTCILDFIHIADHVKKVISYFRKFLIRELYIAFIRRYIENRRLYLQSWVNEQTAVLDKLISDPMLVVSDIEMEHESIC